MLDTIIFLGLIVTIVILSYFALKFYKFLLKKQANAPVLLRKVMNGKQPVVYDSKVITVPENGLGYTYTFWMNVNDWSYRKNEVKHVFHRGSSDMKIAQPAVYLAPKVNDMIIKFELRDHKGDFKIVKNQLKRTAQGSDQELQDAGYKSITTQMTVKEMRDKAVENGWEFMYTVAKNEIPNDETLVTNGIFHTRELENDSLMPAPEELISNQDVYTHVYKKNTDLRVNGNSSTQNADDVTAHVKNIPLNRWVHIGLVINEQACEVYVDGLLHTTKVLPGLLRENNGNLYLHANGGYGGATTQLRYYNKALTHLEIMSIEKQGPEPYQLPDLTGAYKLVLNTEAVCPGSESLELGLDLTKDNMVSVD